VVAGREAGKAAGSAQMSAASATAMAASWSEHAGFQIDGAHFCGV